MHCFDPTWPQHLHHLGSTSASKPQLRPILDPLGSNFGPTAPRWRNLPPTWTHLGGQPRFSWDSCGFKSSKWGGIAATWISMCTTRLPFEAHLTWPMGSSWAQDTATWAQVGPKLRAARAALPKLAIPGQFRGFNATCWNLHFYRDIQCFWCFLALMGVCAGPCFLSWQNQLASKRAQVAPCWAPSWVLFLGCTQYWTRHIWATAQQHSAASRTWKPSYTFKRGKTYQKANRPVQAWSGMTPVQPPKLHLAQSSGHISFINVYFLISWKVSSYGKWSWLAFTPSCQPHRHVNPSSGVNRPSSSRWEAKESRSMNSQMKAFSGAKPYILVGQCASGFSKVGSVSACAGLGAGKLPTESVQDLHLKSKRLKAAA